MNDKDKTKEKLVVELAFANKELAFQNEEKEKRAAELIIADKELVFQNKEKKKRAAELGIANIELAFQDDEKEKRAAELIIANKELTFQNREKEKRADELFIANKELVFQNEEKEKRAAELVIANKELVFQNEEKEKRAAELIIANKELIFQNREKEKRSDELFIANKELVFQNEEKEKRAAELVIANKELAFQNDEKEKRAAKLVIANIEKEKRADELVMANKELLLAKEKAKLVDELIIANEAILQSEKNFYHSISESPVGIRIVSVDGKTIYANKAFLDIYKINSLEEFTYTPSINRYTPESYAQHQERKGKRKNGHDIFDYEINIVCKNMEIRHIKVSRKEILWNGIKHYQVINIDITEQKTLTIDLIAAKEHAEQSDRLKSAFLANMSHEIRTPMNGILGFAALLKEPNLTGTEQQEYIEIIEKSGVRMLNIINDIVDISKIESGLMEVSIKESNINEQIDYIHTFFKPEIEGKGIQFLFKNPLPFSKAIIKTDREKLFAIFTNLVKNAIKYSEKGSIELGYVKRDETLEFYVKDTGIGIPKDRQVAIFERFIQADIGDRRAYQGAGLGLSIAKAYVEMLGGKIWVESEEGIGSTFYFTVPYIESEENKVVGKVVLVQNEKNQIKDLKILIAEDDQTSEKFISITVKEFSKEVLKARTGNEAIKICRTNPDIDLILMDIQMLDLNGYEATRQIRQFNKDVVIIAQTAFGLSGDRKKAIEAGCNDYMAKPIKKDELLSLIQKYFKK